MSFSPSKGYKPEHITDLGWSLLSLLRRIGYDKEETHRPRGRLFKYVRGDFSRASVDKYNQLKGYLSSPRTEASTGTEPIEPAQSVVSAGSRTYYTLTDLGPVSRDTRTGRFVSKRTGLTKPKPTGPKPYKLHLIWQHGKEDELWVELGYFYYLQSCYKRMTKMRVNLARYRRDAKVMRAPTLCIEFAKTGMVRTFDLVPSLNMDVTRISSAIYTGKPTPMLCSWYFPKSWLLDPMKKLKKGGKKKHKAKLKPAEMSYSDG
jgi:hypothetical protein